MGKILIQDAKPWGLTGIVEQANGCVYLYAFERGSYGIVGACWICNTKRTPRSFNQRQIERGIYPRMPAIFCSHPGKGIKIDPSALSFQWSADKNILVLRENGEVLGVITDITKKYSIPYARYASGDTPYAHNLENLSPELKTLLEIPETIPPYVDNSKRDRERKKAENKAIKEAKRAEKLSAKSVDGKKDADLEEASGKEASMAGAEAKKENRMKIKRADKNKKDGKIFGSDHAEAQKNDSKDVEGNDNEHNKYNEKRNDSVNDLNVITYGSLAEDRAGEATAKESESE